TTPRRAAPHHSPPIAIQISPSPTPQAEAAVAAAGLTAGLGSPRGHRRWGRQPNLEVPEVTGGGHGSSSIRRRALVGLMGMVSCKAEQNTNESFTLDHGTDRIDFIRCGGATKKSLGRPI
uniref:Uncharacterized protein n=1 Tax=Triticum urartu TaxID=4572 RepID=A0A8R7QA88_TRIUA